MANERDLVRRVLKDPSIYPDELKSWIQRLIPGNPLITLTSSQIPAPEAVRVVGADATEPAFQHGSPFGGSTEPPGFFKDPFGIVHLRGVVGATYAGGQTIWQLPVGYRPVATEIFVVYTDTGVGRVDVDQNGNVIFVAGGTTFVSLSGISFRAL